MLVEERRLGTTEAHEDVAAFVDILMASFEPKKALRQGLRGSERAKPKS